MHPESPVVKLLSKLVSIPSINPPWIKNPSDAGGTSYCLSWGNFTKCGVSNERQKVATGRDNLLVCLTLRWSKVSYCLPSPRCCSRSSRGIHPNNHRESITWTGACDTKGSVACFFRLYWILHHLLNAHRKPRYFCGAVDEEFAQPDRGHLRKYHYGDLAIVGEPTGLEVVSSHKGSLWIQLETTGKAAHGSTPEKGVNAIEKMHQAMNLLLGEYQNSSNSKSDPCSEGHFEFRYIKGGDQPNIVQEGAS